MLAFTATKKFKGIVRGLCTLLIAFNCSKICAKFSFANQSAAINVLGTNSYLQLDTALTGFTGTLNVKDSLATTVSGNAISMAGGVLVTGNVSAVVNATFNPNPSGTETIVLGNGNYLDVKSGQVLQAVTVSASSTATILGQPKFNSAISLIDATSTLQLGITVPLNQSITGAGTLVLLDDLVLAKNVQVPAVVQQQNYRLVYTGGTINTATTNTTGGAIELAGYTTLTQALTIGTGSDVYYFNGNGCVLDLSSSGSITFNGGTLYLTDVHIRGLSSTNFLGGSGTINMSNVTLELSGNMTWNTGTYTFRGGYSNIIASTSLLTISGTASVTVDGVFLQYTQLDGTGSNPISGTVTLSNGGKVISATSAGSGGLLITGSTYTFAQDFLLSSAATLQVQNSTPGTPKSVAINGGGHYLHFPKTSGSFLLLDANAQTSLSNIVLKDFYPSAITFGTSSTLTMGDNVSVQLGSDVTISSGDKAWAFNGNAEIDGNGYMLQVNKSQGVTITGAKTLSLKNMRLYLTVSDGILALTDTATINFQNIELVLQNPGLLFSAGNLQVNGRVRVSGGTLTSTPTTALEFTTKGTIVIGENAEFFIDRNIVLRYNINPVNDTTLAASKRHMTMAYPGSTITLCGCTLESTATGVAFDQGTVQIMDHVTMNISTSTAAQAEFGSNLRVNLSSGAVLDVEGPLKYVV